MEVKKYVALNKPQVMEKINEGWELIAHYGFDYFVGDKKVPAKMAKALTLEGKTVCMKNSEHPSRYELKKEEETLPVNKTSGDSIFGIAGGNGRGRRFKNMDKVLQIDCYVAADFADRDNLTAVLETAEPSEQDLAEMKDLPTVSGKQIVRIYITQRQMQKFGGKRADVRRYITLYVNHNKTPQSQWNTAT